jgi:hypothetical protein
MRGKSERPASEIKYASADAEFLPLNRKRLRHGSHRHARALVEGDQDWNRLRISSTYLQPLKGSARSSDLAG